MIDIIIATYNGAQFLPSQLDSIIAQKYTDWRILLRDDGSSDATIEILKDYSERLQGKLVILNNEQRNIGIIENFSYLLASTTAPYVMLCDQDDIWNPDKIGLTLQTMKKTELISPDNIPILVHTDLHVVDEQLNTLDKSFWHYQNINPYLGSYNKLLIQNTVTGCTVMINRALLNLALPVPTQVIMHDWWLALIASTFGKITIVNQPTVLYRQHSNNNTGAKEWSLVFIARKTLTLLNSTEISKSIRLTQQQAEAFYKRFSKQLTNRQKNTIAGYINLEQKNWLFKIKFLFRHRLLKQGVIRNIALFLCI